MTDSMKFGPEWLRNMSADGTQNPPAPKYQLAEHRYGREEMLALFDRQVKAPDRLVTLPALYIEKTQPPLALIQMNEEETRNWNRGINSDAVLRLNGKAAPVVVPSVRGGGVAVGRGGSVDRGRGRARGQGYHYTRGLSYEEPGDGLVQETSGSGVKITYNRNLSRPFDRAQSVAGVERGWSERNGGDPQEWNGSTSPRKDYARGFENNNWRRPRGNGEDEDGWRTATGSGSTKYVRPSSWREGDKEGAGGEVGGGRWEGSRGHRAWDGESHRHHADPDNLPEWAMENPSESGGSFDASGAFHGGGHSDEDEESIVSGGRGEPGQGAVSPESVIRRRSPDGARKQQQQQQQPSTHITKSQSTSALPSSNHVKPSSPAKTLQQQQQQSNQNTVKKSTSANAIQVPSPSLNNGTEKILPAPSNHFPLLNTISKQNNNVISYEVNPAYQNTNNGFPPMNAHSIMNAHSVTVNTHSVGGVMNTHSVGGVMNTHNVGGLMNAQSVGGPKNSRSVGAVGMRKSDDDLDRMQVDADSLVDKLTADEEEKKIHQMAAIGQSQEQEKWFYRDPQSDMQGPFAAQEMDEWFRAGYFNVTLLVRRACDERFAQLGDLIKTWGRVPFLAGPYIPPLKNEIPSPVSMSAPVPQVKPMPGLDQESIMQHQQQQQQYQYQQLLHRQAQAAQHQQQQVAFQAIVGKLSQTERWPTLTPQEQQQLVMQQMVDPSVFLAPLQQPQQQTSIQKNPVLQQFISQMKPADKQHPTLPPLHPLQQLIQQMGGMTQPIGHQMHSQEAGLKSGGPIGHQMHGLEAGHKLEQDPIHSLLRQMGGNNALDVWGNPMNTSSWMGQMPAAPPPGQVPMSMWDLQGKDMKTEQQIIEERLRAEEEKRVEDAMKKAEVDEKRRKHKEELTKIKELERQRLEEERQKIEEERRETEEKRMQELQEQKRLDDEIRKREKEEKKRKEEEKKKREEEKKRKEEEKERKRKLEEERKRDEEERKRVEEEAARKRQEDEEQIRRVEQQHQALKRLQERAKAAPWSQQATQQPQGNSLAEIQRQEKVQKERESREQQQMLQTMQLIQQQQQQQAAVLQSQTDKNSSNLQLKWADRKPHVSKVKSLSEIQAEEAKHSERERAERAVKDPVAAPSAGIWSAAPQSLSWATAANAAWSSSSQQGGGFWDDVPATPTPPPQPRPAPKAKSTPAPAPATPKAAAPAKTRNKKEEAVVMKLFDNQRGDDFTQWCSTSLHNIEAHVDIPTFVGFLRDIESPYEVKDYVKMYLGESKESQEFARQFLERRSKWRSAQRAAPQHDDLAQPAPAINPSSQDFTEVKGKAKKIKKNKMCKVDSRILGFSVTAAQDRINVGDRDYGEGV